MIFRITNGTTTVNLHGGPIHGGEDYVPRAPEVTEQEFTAESLRDGGELIEATRRNVAESFPAVITGATIAALQATLHTVEQLLEEAVARQRAGTGARVYVEYRPGASGDIYRSEILRGVVEPQQGYAGDKWLEAGAIGVLVAWKRRFYWEGPEVELSLTNSHGTGTGGRTVYNHNDAAHNNYVEIAAASVGGVIPAPARLELTNSYDAAALLRRVWIAHNVSSAPATFPHILEGEAASSGGTTEANAGCSNGEYQTVTWTADAMTALLRWDLSTALLGAAAGRWFHVLARWFMSSPTTERFKLAIVYNAFTLWEGPEIKFASTEAFLIRSLGLVRLPPWLVDTYTSVALELVLYGRKTGGSTVRLDFLQLSPTDSFRHVYATGYGVPYGERLIDDGITGSVYRDSGAASARYGYFATRGGDVLLIPGQKQRLYFLSHSWLGDVAEIARTMSVKVFHRPRRLTL